MQAGNSLESFGRLMTSLEGLSLTPQDKKLLSNKHVGGIVLFSKNFESQLQIQSLCSEIKALKENIIIAVDQEGGRVQRFKNEFTALPSMQDLGNYVINKNNFEICHEVGWLMASELAASGIDISFAPVLDVDKETSSIIGNRAFSNDPDLVSKLAGKFINGMNEAGMQATGKHFPGHGRIFEDSHISEPFDIRSYEELLEVDLKPFIELKNNLGSLMTAHITFPKVDDICVSYSDIWIKKILKEKLAFEGIVFSDDLSMKGAGDFSMGEKAMKSIKAGCDMVLVCNNYEGTMDVIDAFEKNDVQRSAKIKDLKNFADINWNNLENQNRAKDVKNIIKEMVKT
ncbi:beta-N-acetylhexosaminidase [Gammaproteobacteria bacterium]|nr:beta-N-acetylhexosaminidase [Gammaproteobacteria bacterium]